MEIRPLFHPQVSRFQISNPKESVYVLEAGTPVVKMAFSGRSYDRPKQGDFLREVGIPEESVASVDQVHGAHLVKVVPENMPHGDVAADGMITVVPGMALSVRTADCFPVFLWDSERKAAGIVHAGWRGIHHGIIDKAVQALRHNFLCRKGHLFAALGPGIRKCCYEVGEEFAEIFPKYFTALPGSEANASVTGRPRGRVDLAAAIVAELHGQGVLPQHIYDTGICTACQNSKFFSYRKEKENVDRILSVIQLNPRAS